jgi:hypothetical protein
MRLTLYGLGWALAASFALAADSAGPGSRPEWRGMIDLDRGQSFLVVAPGETAGNWEKVGDNFGEWTVASYRAADHILVVQRRDGTKLELVMNESPATAAAPPPAPARFDIAINYLHQRAAQLQREEIEAEKAYRAFRERHEGADPSQMPPGVVADEGNLLKARVKVAHDNYVTVLERLGETQRRNAGVPPSAPAPAPSN